MGKVKRNLASQGGSIPSSPDLLYNAVSSIFGDNEISPHSGRHKHIGFTSITLKAGCIEAHYIVTGYSGLTMEGTMTVQHTSEDGFGQAISVIEEEMRKLYRKAEKVA